MQKIAYSSNYMPRVIKAFSRQLHSNKSTKSVNESESTELNSTSIFLFSKFVSTQTMIRNICSETL